MLKPIFFIIIFALITGCQTESPPNKVPIKDFRLFTLLSPDETGVKFANNVPDNEYVNILTYEYFYNGAGVAVGDINQDGLPDLYFTANMGSNKLFLNKGNLKFEDITESAGVGGGKGWSTGVTMADVNSDGFLDIYVSRSGKFNPELRRNQLFINNGDLTFTEKAAEFGLDNTAYSTQAMFFDFDLDNDLDVFLINHSIRLYHGLDAMQLMDQHDPHAGDKLLQNVDGKFIDVSKQAGIRTNPLGYGLGIAAGDLNKDGWPDLYVTNDYLELDYMYINNGNGTFTNEIKSSTGHISNFGMGVDIADINNDSHPDIVVSDMVAEDNYRQKTNMRSMNPEEFYQAVEFGFHYQYMFNTLQLNRGNGYFSEIGQLAGISSTDWSWATLLVDLDNDQFRDLIITNGFRKEYTNKDYTSFKEKISKQASGMDQDTRVAAMKTLLENLPENKIGNYVFRNNGDLTFSNYSEAWNFNQPSYSNGATYADLDMDGDLEVIINNIDATASIYKNETIEEGGGNFIKIHLKGPPKNPMGIGAKVSVFTSGIQQTYEQYLTRGYQSSIDPLIHFGMGGFGKADSITVIWPDGFKYLKKNLAANQTVQISYTSENKIKKDPVTALPIFIDLTDKINLDYIHVENEYSDFEKELLLPHKMSNFGPALDVADLNNDGLEDIIVGGAKGYPAQIFYQDQNMNFSGNIPASFKDDLETEDVGVAIFDANGDAKPDIYMVSGGNEYPEKSPLLQDRLYLNVGNGNFEKSTELPEMYSSGSVVRPFDFDNDGDTDLFVGGRVTPGKYPFPPRSYLLENTNGSFEDVTEQVAPELVAGGMITDAIWTDFNGDNYQDLIVVGEWMPILMMENQNGVFKNVSNTNAMDQETGWWFSIEEGDFNQDGLPDYIVGNLGLNYKYKASYLEPFQIYCDDFDNSGTLDIVLGYFNEGELYPLRGRQCSSDQMPFIKEKFETYHEFGSANLEEVYGRDALSSALHYEARNFSSSLLINQGSNQFELSPLPNICQISNINSSIIDDFNGDSILDILIAGNLYPVEPETIRNDALIGQLLLGIGDGTFDPIEPSISGIFLKKDVKHMHPIQLGDQSGIIVANNQDGLQILILNKSYDFKMTKKH